MRTQIRKSIELLKSTHTRTETMYLILLKALFVNDYTDEYNFHIRTHTHTSFMQHYIS